MIVDAGNHATYGASAAFARSRHAICSARSSRAMVRVIDPRIGETVYDPGCGTGGFLAQSYEHIAGPNNEKIRSPDQIEALKRRTFYGRGKDNTIYPLALANLVLHGFDEPDVWHANSLTGAETYGGLFTDAPTLYDVIPMNPPFGGKEGKDARIRLAYKTGATQVLFLQHVIDSLKSGARCGMVIDEGVLFRTNETAFVQTKRKLLDGCDLWCIVSLPPRTFVNAGAGVKANLLFFTKGQHTERVWYYNLSDIKVAKKSPLALDKFAEFFQLLPDRTDSLHSWTVDMGERKRLATEEARPFKEEANRRNQEADRWKARLAELKKAKRRDEAAIGEAEKECEAMKKQAKIASGKAKQIENAVYDLKAVNPHAKNNQDTRTPDELLELIEAKGREISEALAALRATNTLP